MIATPGQRNRLMQKLRAETWIRRKNGTEGESGTDAIKLIVKEERCWGRCPQTPGIYRVDANPSE